MIGGRTLLNTLYLFCSQLPAFVPVHESKRKAYQGILGTKSYSARFEADRITSWVPVRFMHLEGLYDLFVSKLVGIHAISFTLHYTLTN